MDNQLPTPNSAPSPERPSGVSPESVQPVSPAPEAAAAGNPAPPPAKLDAADVAAVIAATPTVGSGAPGSAAMPGTAAGTPLVAGDVDVIEPEWVDKAEAVVRQHQGDPYAEEEAIEELQEDYLQKRYGINVAEPVQDDTKPKGT